jgi:hypothetical protein
LSFAPARQRKDFLTFGGLNLDLFLKHAEVEKVTGVDTSGSAGHFFTWFSKARGRDPSSAAIGIAGWNS